MSIAARKPKAIELRIFMTISKIVDLAPRGHQTNFSDQDAGPTVAQAGCVKVRSDLAGAISDNGTDSQPVSLGEGNYFARFHLRGKAG